MLQVAVMWHAMYVLGVWIRFNKNIACGARIPLTVVSWVPGYFVKREKRLKRFALRRNKPLIKPTRELYVDSIDFNLHQSPTTLVGLAGSRRQNGAVKKYIIDFFNSFSNLIKVISFCCRCTAQAVVARCR